MTFPGVSELTTMDEEIWDAAADVVVVGSGAAGFAAAVTAAVRGGSVIMLERADWLGGTTAKSGATYWVPNNPLMREKGMTDPREYALRYMARLSFPPRYAPGREYLGLSRHQYNLLAAYYDNASLMVEELMSAGALQPVLDLATPDYNADLPEDLAPYGRHLRPDFVPDGTGSTGGDMLIAGLRAAAEARGVRILLGHRVTDVIRSESDAVVGVEAHRRSGTVLVRARRGVVFASGGFAHNAELAATYLRGPIFGGCAAGSNTGDLVRIAASIGADLGNMSNAWWSQVVVESAVNGPTIKDVWLPFGDSMIQVNRHGERAVNEKMVYNERSQVHFSWSAHGREYPNLLMFMLYDDAVANAPGDMSSMRQPVPLAGQEAPYVISGATWDDLALALEDRLQPLAGLTGGLRLAPDFAGTLRRTVARFNEFAKTGADLDFHRGETPIQVAWHGTPRRPDMPNPTMHAFAEHGPYHAIILGAGALDTKGGPRIDADGRILSVDGEPIAGLYGAGNCIAAPAGQAYWSAGATIGSALTFGYLAGRHVASADLNRL
jgi:3-oxosteroid 1-dehydrogenase